MQRFLKFFLCRNIIYIFQIFQWHHLIHVVSPHWRLNQETIRALSNKRNFKQRKRNKNLLDFGKKCKRINKSRIFLPSPDEKL